MRSSHVGVAALILGVLAVACSKTSTGDETSTTSNGGGANTSQGGGNSTGTGTSNGTGNSTGTGTNTGTGNTSSSSAGGASSTSSNNGGTSSTGTATTPSVITSTCIVGTKGCLCDTTGKCGSGLTCTPKGAQSVCCSGTDCTGTGTSIGASCAPVTSAATCTPGVTIPTATGNNDNCGYVASSFAESVIMCAIMAQGGGDTPAEVQAFFNDEWPLTLGCNTSTYPVSTMSGNPSSVFFPQTGDPRCVDTSNRPMRPSLFITDITSDPNCKAGDQQNGGKAYDPVAVFGAWTDANMAANNTGTPVRTNLGTLNMWNLGTGADPVPAQATQACPCTQGNCITTGHTGRGYGAEVRYEAGLISGHSYRLQVQMHDGDQTQGGDAGEACVIFCAGTGTCTPKTCADYPDACGQQPDGCGGLTPVCNTCNCTPQTCEAACPEVTPGAGVTCQTAQDGNTGFILPCNVDDNCGGKIACWCPVG